MASMWPIYKTKMLIYQSEADLEVKFHLLKSFIF